MSKTLVEVYMLTVIFSEDNIEHYSFIHEFDRDEFIADIRVNHKEYQFISWNKWVTIDNE